MIESRNAFTGDLLKKFPYLTELEVDRKLQQLFLAQQSWSDIEVQDRIKHLGQLMFHLEIELERLSMQISKEVGKPISQSKMEVEKSIATIKHYMLHSENYLQEMTVSSQYSTARVRPLPLGIILAVMPWNFPLWQIIRCAVPALLSGNAIALKHSPEVQGTAEMIEKLFTISLPVPVLHNFCISKEQTQALLKNKKIAALSFTGSTSTGRQLAAQAGANLKKTVLELGSHDPAVIFNSADLNLAAKKVAWGRLQNSGQSCIAVKRVFVQKDVFTDFMQLLKAEFQSISIGDPMNYATELGPLQGERFRLQAEKQLAEQLLCPGNQIYFKRQLPDNLGSGAFVAPTLVLSDRAEGPLWEEEVFAPILPVTCFESSEDLLAYLKNDEYNLGCTVFIDPKDPVKSELEGELKYGTLVFNALLSSDPRLPFGGQKQSGYGVELGWQGLYEFCAWQVVAN